MNKQMCQYNVVRRRLIEQSVNLLFVFILGSVSLFSNILFAAETLRDYPGVGRFPGSNLVQHKETSFANGIIPLSKNSYKTPNEFERLEVAGKRTTLIYDIPEQIDSTVEQVLYSLEAGFLKQGFDIRFNCIAESQFESCGYFLHQQVVSEKTAKSRFSGFKNFYNLNKATVGMLSVSQNDLNAWVVVAKSPYSPNIQYALDIFADGKLIIKDPVLTSGGLTKDIFKNGRAVLTGLYFDFNQSTLNPESQDSLATISTYLKAHSNSSYLIVGHTDTHGTYQHNLVLSQARANEVKSTLVKKYGVTSSQLQSTGVGYASPIASNNSESSRAKNRRVEIVLKNKREKE